MFFTVSIPKLINSPILSRIDIIKQIRLYKHIRILLIGNKYLMIFVLYSFVYNLSKIEKCVLVQNVVDLRHLHVK